MMAADRELVYVGGTLAGVCHDAVTACRSATRRRSSAACQRAAARVRRRRDLQQRPRRAVPALLIVALLLIWTFIAKRTTFGRHVYAVGGNAEAARRAGINVARIRILVFMISGGMAAARRHRARRAARASTSKPAEARSCSTRSRPR